MSLLFPINRDAESAEFFDATAQGQLVVRRCDNGHYLPAAQGWFGQAVRCTSCGTTEIQWVPASGESTLVTWTVNYKRDGSIRSTAGIVELEEGPWMEVLLGVDDPSTLRAGIPLEVDFVSSGEGGEVIPVFSPR